MKFNFISKKYNFFYWLVKFSLKIHNEILIRSPASDGKG
ncbi:MAG: hypothetical protein UZ09_BCD002002514 [Bacteroidetes bacterium OLB9]|nr:MAG: hypothetical protein UZ09_BCD002002514 [Bacteroidetes bacterium OLB9]